MENVEDYAYEHQFTIALNQTTKTSANFFTGLLEWELSSEAWDEFSLSGILLICKPPKRRKHFAVKIRTLIQISQSEPQENCAKFLKESEILSDKQPICRFSLKDEDTAKFKGDSLECFVQLAILDNEKIWPLVDNSINFMAEHHTANATLVVSGKKFYVNIDLLSLESAFFADIRSSRKEREHVTIQMDETDPETMSLILRCLYFSFEFITLENVSKLLFAAKKFKFECILLRCENFLINEFRNVPLARLLQLSYTYDMTILQTFCLRESTSSTSNPKQVTQASRHLQEEFSLPEVVPYRVQFYPFWTFYSKQVHPILPITYLAIEISWNESHFELIASFKQELTTNWSIVLGIAILDRKQVKFEEQDVVLNAQRPVWSFQCDRSIFKYAAGYISVLIKSLRGLRAFVKVIFAHHSKTVLSDLKLIDEKENAAYVNVHSLAHFSPYFEVIRNKLGDLPKDGLYNLAVSVIDEVTLKDLLTLLQKPCSWLDVFTGNRDTIFDQACALSMAQKFLFTRATIGWTICLLQVDSPSALIIQTAINCNVEPLLEAQLKLFKTSEEVLREMSKDDSDVLKLILIERYLELP